MKGGDPDAFKRVRASGCGLCMPVRVCVCEHEELSACVQGGVCAVHEWKNACPCVLRCMPMHAERAGNVHWRTVRVHKTGS